MHPRNNKYWEKYINTYRISQVFLILFIRVLDHVHRLHKLNRLAIQIAQVKYPARILYKSFQHNMEENIGLLYYT